jgi:SAM-dependent methyltransferase
MTSESSYQRPAHIPADMGGDGISLDARLSAVLRVMESVPLTGGRALDVGMGNGQLSLRLASYGFSVTGTGLAFDSYGLDRSGLTGRGIDCVECSAESMPFADETFDVTVMSHVLEHCANPKKSLEEVWRVMKDDGLLCIFVPPNDGYICSGHVSCGWNIGQLIYNLVLSGFAVAQGKFVEYQGSVCAFVRKSKSLQLPALRGDRGDLYLLHKAGLLPLPIRSKDGFDDGFWGDIGAINWEESDLRRLISALPLKHRVARALLRLVPTRAARVVQRLGRYILLAKSLNPKFLE